MYSCADWRIPHGLYIVHTRIISTAGEIRYQIKSNQYVCTIPIQRDIDFSQERSQKVAPSCMYYITYIYGFHRRCFNKPPLTT